MLGIFRLVTMIMKCKYKLMRKNIMDAVLIKNVAKGVNLGGVS